MCVYACVFKNNSILLMFDLLHHMVFLRILKNKQVPKIYFNYSYLQFLL